MANDFKTQSVPIANCRLCEMKSKSTLVEVAD
jgi:hypothetical protein